MEKVTHILDIRIAVDMSELLKEENINGAKLVLGASNNDDLVGKYTTMVVEEINNKVLNSRPSHFEMTEAALKIHDDFENPIEESEDFFDNEVPEIVKPLDQEDVQNEKKFSEGAELLESDLDDWANENIAIQTIEDIAESIFEAKSLMGKNFTIYISKEDSILSSMVVERYPSYEVRDIEELNELENKVADTSQGFVLQYENINENLKFIPSL